MPDTTESWSLAELGFGPDFALHFDEHRRADFEPGRVAVQHKDEYGVLTEAAELVAQPSGRMRYEAPGLAHMPAVGDWVALEPRSGGRATIHAILPRRTAFTRMSAGRSAERQVVAANVDCVFLVSGLDGDLSPRRLERYLVVAWESGARPAIVLTKADLCEEIEACVAEVEQVALGVPVHVVSNVTGEGLDELRPYFAEGQTVAALGSSGVGKSTLVNRLLGSQLQAVAKVRADGRGRHTTTRRELIPLPDGGFFLDTPGMRELQLADASSGFGGTFDDIAALASECRFSDCAHRHEPGCAVLGAIETGELDPARMASYRKLERELAAAERRLDARARAESKKRWRRMERARRKVSW